MSDENFWRKWKLTATEATSANALASHKAINWSKWIYCHVLYFFMDSHCALHAVGFNFFLVWVLLMILNFDWNLKWHLCFLAFKMNNFSSLASFSTSLNRTKKETKFNELENDTETHKKWTTMREKWENQQQKKFVGSYDEDFYSFKYSVSPQSNSLFNLLIID